MAALSPWIIFLLVLNAYFLLLFALVKSGWLNRLGMGLMGPVLMLKTERGRGLLDFFARARGFFNGAVALGTALTYFFMVSVSLLIIVQVWFIAQIPADQAPSPRLLLGIPGVNPIIHVWYGTLALIIAVVVHEFGHGILARVHQIRVKTMGILFLVVPIGAFVEPDEEELKKAPRKQRIRVFGAGPTMNLLFALLFAFIFSPLLMAQAEPVEGVPVLAVDKDGPACASGILPGGVLTHVADSAAGANRTKLGGRRDFLDFLQGAQPNRTIYFNVRDGSVSSEDADQPCFNGTNTAAGVFPVTLVACVAIYEPAACWASGNATGHPDPPNRPVMGVELYPHDEHRAVLANPFSTFGNPGDRESWRGLLVYISLPFDALSGQFPLEGTFQDFYDVPFNPAVFWLLANAAYWIFWLNLMVGLTNALPILPLDGGHMFRDAVGGWIQKRNPQLPEERRDAIVRRISIVLSLLLVFLVLFQFIGPPLFEALR